MRTFALIHSPLVGRSTWARVANDLRRRGVETIVPALPDSALLTPPYWKHHVEAVARAVESAQHHLILVGHSGAGPLLPAVREPGHPPAAPYLFVGAGLQRAGASRLDLFEPREAAEQFRQSASHGLLP